ncbi:MAG: hypothetical protein ACP5D5_09100 [Acidithiobacillus sp.]|uniref:hypothetical protein n=1 Tax=Acidithiobacillus sp. TaxID=1872118 RepID=UPI003D03DE1E
MSTEALSVQIKALGHRILGLQETLKNLVADQEHCINRIRAGESGVAPILETVIKQAQDTEREIGRLQGERAEAERELQQMVEQERRAAQARKDAEWQGAMDELIAAYGPVAVAARKIRIIADQRGMRLDAALWRHLPEIGNYVQLNGAMVKIGGGQ